MHVLPRPAPAALRLLAAVLVAVLLGGCSPETYLHILAPGVINNPSNKRLRFDILQYGLSEFCEEAQQRGTGLRLVDTGPAIGRFFATSCQPPQVDADRQLVTLTFGGQGYAYNDVTGRLGFTASATVRYHADFVLHDGAMYVYFRALEVTSSSFETVMVESTVARTGITLTGVHPNALGRKIFEDQLRRGFTVIRYNSKGETDFGVGVVPVGQRPFHPFNTRGSGQRTLANEASQLSNNQQDYVTGLRMEDDGALEVTLNVQGTAAIEAFLLPLSVSTPMLDRYVRQAGGVPPTSAPLMSASVFQGQTFKQKVKVPAGSYVLVLDHSTAGAVAPSHGVARVDYLVQVADD